MFEELTWVFPVNRSNTEKLPDTAVAIFSPGAKLDISAPIFSY